MTAPRYVTYKDSRVKWLGDIPDHWGVLQSRRMFAVRSEPALATDQMLTASQKYGVLFQKDFVEMEGRRVAEVIMGTESLKHVEPDDFIISMRSFQGGLEWSKLRGSTSFHYVMVKPVKGVHPPFFAHLFKSVQYIQALRSTTDLIRDGQELRYSNFVQVDLPLVPAEEQEAIAIVLDRETAKIDALVEEQRRLIELLKEKRQAVILRAVTKGLDANAPMKDSGVQWLGKVPAHWIVVPLKRIVTLKSGGTPDKNRPDYWDGDVPWASAKDLKVDLLPDTADHISEIALAEGAATLISTGTVLVVVRGMILARTFPVVTAKVDMAINQDLKAVTARAPSRNDWLAWLLRASTVETLSRLDEAGHGTKALRMDAWGDMRVAVPPPDEQERIASFLRSECERIDSLVSEADRAITLLAERRSSLVSAVVTGKFDVRGLVPQSEEVAA